MCLATFFLPKLTQKTAKTTPNGVKNVKLHSIYLDFNIEDTEDTERALRLKFTKNKLKITIFSKKTCYAGFTDYMFFLSVTSVPLWEMAKKYLIEIRW